MTTIQRIIKTAHDTAVKEKDSKQSEVHVTNILESTASL